MPDDIHYVKAGYPSDRWKWVLSLPCKDKLFQEKELIPSHLSEELIYKTYGLDKIPKKLPCMKKCSSSPWCLSDIKNKEGKKKQPPTESPQIDGIPVGLQNTAYTCWINSALQSLYHIFRFKNGINSLSNFKGDSSFNSVAYLLQSVFVEMEKTKYAALACAYGSFFEKLAIFATREILQEDQATEVLKCVSEFLENTIDKLLGDPESGPIFTPMFKINLFRVARWCCPTCHKEHQEQMPTETVYTMAAYVTGDECPLNHCILDLQTDTQTGVSLSCRAEDGGCGETVKADRIVTPRILELPNLLIIRNNSLADAGNRKRQHVVYPEVLDLADYSCEREFATYTLRSVIFHHGSWVKHFTAHVKAENGKWFNFNDEFVTGLVRRSSTTTPLENNPNYLSLANVAVKYKHRSHVRVSRGAFIWIYERNSSSKPLVDMPPSKNLLDYIVSKNGIALVRNEEDVKKVQMIRTNLLNELSISDKCSEVSIISRKLLAAWASSSEIDFIMMPSLLKHAFCEHGKYDPTVVNNVKCLKTSKVGSLLGDDCGIKCSQFRPSVIPELKEGICLICIAAHVHHILFREKLKELFFKAKKENSKEPRSDCTFLGKHTLNSWPKLAASTYLASSQIGEKQKSDNDDEDDEISKEEAKCDSADELPHSNDFSNIDKTEHEEQEEKEATSNSASLDPESTVFFNEDIVCSHNMQDPEAAGVWVPNNIASEIKELCSETFHPALLQNDFGLCPDCLKNYNHSRASIDRGMTEKKKNYHVYLERRRPHPIKETGSKVFLLSRKFFSEWKSYIKSCEKEDLNSVIPPKSIDNSPLVCQHDKIALTRTLLTPPLISRHCLVLTVAEWMTLKESYDSDFDLSGELLENGCISTSLSVCDEGCADKLQAQLEEERFIFSNGLINIRQVDSESDIPQNSTIDEPLPKRQRNCPKSFDDEPTTSRLNKRLIRASRLFSSNDTIKEVQNYIAERTGIWPLLQTLWLSPSVERGSEPILMTDKHRSMTLHSLKVKAEDTIYFRALKSDLEKAAGNGIVEFDEMDD